MRKMTEVFAYVLGASHSTDSIECYVPEKVDRRTIFFGPCKRDLRKELKTRFLRDEDIRNISKFEIYLVGFNASNREKERRIVWIGKVDRVMTFERAFRLFNASRRIPRSLHLQPLYQNGQLVGYKHVGRLHKKDNDWVWDIINRRRKTIGNLYSLKDSQLILKDGRYRQDVFERDCCFVCENLFFVGDGVVGMEITKNTVDILKEKQPDKEIDEYYIFGSKRPPGFTLHMKDDIADRLIKELVR